MKIGDAPAQGHYITKTAEKIRPEGLSKTREVHPGDLILSNSMSFGKPYIMGIDGCIHDGWLLIRDTNSTFDLTFLCHLLGTPQMLDQYRSLAAGSTVNNLNKELVGNTVVTIPTIDEQRVLGQYLERLDNLITLHQRQSFSHSTPDISLSVQLIHPFYTSSWEQRKLTEFVEFFSGLTYTPNDVQENGTLVLRSSNVSNGEVVDADNIYVNPQVVNSENVKVGDIVVVVRNGSRSLIGKHAQIKAFMPNTVIGAFMTGIRSECPEFTNALLNTSRFEEEIAMNMGATINQITGYMFSKMEFKVPCLDEQKKIGEYFEKLDNLITLHQRECISFTGRADRLILTANKKRTTSSWEQRKFGEITSKYEDPVPTPHDGYYRLGIRSHAKGTFHSYVAKGQELETAQMHRVAAGNFIVNITFGWEHAVAITDKNDAGKLVSHRFPQFSFAEGMVPEFFRYVIVDEKFRHHLWLASPGGAGRNRVLKLDEMLNYLMRFPSRDEQIKIAEFFRHLDNLITLHQRKPFLMKWRTSDANRNQTNRLVL